MNSLYTLIHTAVVFVAGSGSILAVNANAAFAVDLVLMGLSATVIYGYLFRKTNYNVLYVLLIGTVLTSFFGSIQSTLTRIMDPNEYDSLLTTLVASFSNVNAEIIVFSLVVLALLIVALRKDLALLDVLTLGKEQAINLGVDYDKSVRRLLLGVTLAIAVATAVVGAHLLYGAHHRQSLPPAAEDLPAQPADCRLRPFWHDNPGGGAADCGACLHLCHSHQCFHHSRGRCVFPVSLAHETEGMNRCE